MRSAEWPCPAPSVNFMALGYMEKSRKGNMWFLSIKSYHFQHRLAQGPWTLLSLKVGVEVFLGRQLHDSALVESKGPQGLNDSISKETPIRAGHMLWSLNLAKNGNFCLLEGLCQSLKETPRAMGQTATGHTRQSSPLWDRSSSQILPRSLSVKEPPLVLSS